MGIDYRHPRRGSPAPGSPAAPTLASSPDWSRIGSIRAEWPKGSLDPAADLRSYRQALVLYDRDDYAAMMQCATWFATALAHSLYGDGILRGNDLPNTVHKTLYCALFAPPDGKTFADNAQRAARLALTIMRENRWQPPAFGGTNPFFEPMMTDTGNRMLLSAAIGPPDEPWKGDLRAFFSVPAASPTGTPLDAATARNAAVDRTHSTLEPPAADDTAYLGAHQQSWAEQSGAGSVSGGGDQSWPTGMAGYDRLMAQADRGLGNGEREAVASHIASDEPVVGRHYAWEVSSEADGILLKDGAVIVSTDRKLLLVSARGTFRSKFAVKAFPYGELMPGVGNSDGEVFGQQTWYSGFGVRRGATYVVRFFTKGERDQFVSDVSGALGAWHIIHGHR